MPDRPAHLCPVMETIHREISTAPWRVQFHRDLVLVRLVTRLPIGPALTTERTEARVFDLVRLAGRVWLPRLADEVGRLAPDAPPGALRRALDELTADAVEGAPAGDRAVGWATLAVQAESFTIALAERAVTLADLGRAERRDGAAAVRRAAMLAEGARGVARALECMGGVEGSTSTSDAVGMTVEALRACVPRSPSAAVTRVGRAYPLEGPAVATILDSAIEDLAERWPVWMVR